jgi:hypothetical protein
MPLVRCSPAAVAAGQRDHDGVVATEQDVDHDDLADGDPEMGVRNSSTSVSFLWGWGKSK